MATTKNRTFSSGRAAVANARRLEAKGEISQRELRGVERVTDHRNVSDAPHTSKTNDAGSFKELRAHYEGKKR